MFRPLTKIFVVVVGNVDAETIIRPLMPPFSVMLLIATSDVPWNTTRSMSRSCFELSIVKFSISTVLAATISSPSRLELLTVTLSR
ncbi:hypothetical protein D3C80_1928460 [compost metagenome]